MKKPLFVVVLVALLGAAPVGQAPPAQQGPQSPVQPDRQMPPITFRAEVNYVEVDAVVRDSQGRFVRDLRQEDFQILENGKPQTVSNFSLVEIPVTRQERPLFAPRAVEPDVRSNVGGPEGRVYVLLLDDVHTHITRSARVRSAVRQFIERNLGANDVAAVVHTSGRQDAGQEFTNNRRLLTQAVDKFMGRKIRSATQEKIDEYYRMRDMGMSDEAIRDPLEFERAYNARSVLDTIRNVSQLLSGVSGRRKALVLFSEGIDYDITDFVNSRDALTVISETREAIASATRGNVNIYSVDPRGLSNFGEEGIEMQVPADADPNLHLGMTGLMREGRLAQESLRVLAEETGGFAAVNSNDFATAFERIVDENSTYYVMGYYPTNARRDGTFRKIEVRVSRPGVTVKARRGYVASRGRPSSKADSAYAGTSAPLAAALNAPLQVGGLPLTVFAAPFRGPAPNAAVALVTHVSGMQTLAFGQKDGKHTNRIELSVIAVDAQGKIRGGTRETVELGLRPDTYQRVQQLGFRILSHFEVPPGRYQVRVAAREEGGKIGSVHYDLVVPDFSKVPLELSGIALASAWGGAVPTAGKFAELQGALPAPPTAARVFNAADQIALLAEVYDNRPTPSHSVEIAATIRGDDGRQVFATSETRSSSELGGKPGGYGYTAVIPLKELEPGLYILKVEARSTLEQSASREVQIRVVR